MNKTLTKMFLLSLFAIAILGQASAAYLTGFGGSFPYSVTPADNATFTTAFPGVSPATAQVKTIFTIAPPTDTATASSDIMVNAGAPGVVGGDRFCTGASGDTDASDEYLIIKVPVEKQIYGNFSKIGVNSGDCAGLHLAVLVDGMNAQILKNQGTANLTFDPTNTGTLNLIILNNGIVISNNGLYFGTSPTNKANYLTIDNGANPIGGLENFDASGNNGEIHIFAENDVSLYNGGYIGTNTGGTPIQDFYANNLTMRWASRLDYLAPGATLNVSGNIYLSFGSQIKGNGTGFNITTTDLTVFQGTIQLLSRIQAQNINLTNRCTQSWGRGCWDGSDQVLGFADTGLRGGGNYISATSLSIIGKTEGPNVVPKVENFNGEINLTGSMLLNRALFSGTISTLNAKSLTLQNSELLTVNGGIAIGQNGNLTLDNIGTTSPTNYNGYQNSRLVANGSINNASILTIQNSHIDGSVKGIGAANLIIKNIEPGSYAGNSIQMAGPITVAENISLTNAYVDSGGYIMNVTATGTYSSTNSAILMSSGNLTAGNIALNGASAVWGFTISRPANIYTTAGNLTMTNGAKIYNLNTEGNINKGKIEIKNSSSPNDFGDILITNGIIKGQINSITANNITIDNSAWSTNESGINGLEGPLTATGNLTIKDNHANAMDPSYTIDLYNNSTATKSISVSGNMLLDKANIFRINGPITVGGNFTLDNKSALDDQQNGAGIEKIEVTGDFSMKNNSVLKNDNHSWAVPYIKAANITFDGLTDYSDYWSLDTVLKTTGIILIKNSTREVADNFKINDPAFIPTKLTVDSSKIRLGKDVTNTVKKLEMKGTNPQILSTGNLELTVKESVADTGTNSIIGFASLVAFMAANSNLKLNLDFTTPEGGTPTTLPSLQVYGGGSNVGAKLDLSGPSTGKLDLISREINANNKAAFFSNSGSNHFGGTVTIKDINNLTLNGNISAIGGTNVDSCANAARTENKGGSITINIDGMLNAKNYRISADGGTHQCNGECYGTSGTVNITSAGLVSSQSTRTNLFSACNTTDRWASGYGHATVSISNSGPLYLNNVIAKLGWFNGSTVSSDTTESILISESRILAIKGDLKTASNANPNGIIIQNSEINNPANVAGQPASTIRIGTIDSGNELKITNSSIVNSITGNVSAKDYIKVQMSNVYFNPADPISINPHADFSSTAYTLGNCIPGANNCYTFLSLDNVYYLQNSTATVTVKDPSDNSSLILSGGDNFSTVGVTGGSLPLFNISSCSSKVGASPITGDACVVETSGKAKLHVDYYYTDPVCSAPPNQFDSLLDSRCAGGGGGGASCTVIADPSGTLLTTEFTSAVDSYFLGTNKPSQATFDCGGGTLVDAAGAPIENPVAVVAGHALANCQYAEIPAGTRERYDVRVSATASGQTINCPVQPVTQGYLLGGGGGDGGGQPVTETFYVNAFILEKVGLSKQPASGSMEIKVFDSDSGAQQDCGTGIFAISQGKVTGIKTFTCNQVISGKKYTVNVKITSGTKTDTFVTTLTA